MILLVLLKFLGSSRANFAKNFLWTSILAQYILRLCRFLLLLAGQTPSGFFTFESAWANFVISLLAFMLSSHVVGSFWYLFGLQRINQCLRDACHSSGLKSCMRFMECGCGGAVESFILDTTWNSWKNNVNSSACFKDGFSYGIFIKAVDVSTKDSIITRYVYSLFWGCQQIHNLARNQIPSCFVWEVLFIMVIKGLGLLLLALAIGNTLNFIQALGKRRLEMLLRHSDVEHWMSHRCLPEELRRRVRKAEWYNWAATRGVNEEMLLKNLPEGLQRDIRRHLFKFVKKIRIFTMMEDRVIDAFCERLEQRIYIEESKTLYPGGLIEEMVFIVHGEAESIGEDGRTFHLSERDVCGEELLIWCLEHFSVIKNGEDIGIAGPRLFSYRMVRCLTNVEAFALGAADLEQVTSLFARILRNTRVQRTIRYESPYCRDFAARSIQVAWKYYGKRLKHASISQSNDLSE